MSAAVADDRWSVLRRRRQYEAEIRVNVVRIAAIGAFYLIHLLHHWAATSGHAWLHGIGLDAGNALAPIQHTALTFLVLAWIMAAVVVQQFLQARRLPPWLMYASTAADLVFLTSALTLSAGAASPLVAGYFLIVIMSGLRFDLRLVRATTCGAVAGYLFLLGAAKWPIGLLQQYPLPIVPRYQQLMVVAALLLAGTLVGQWLRHARKLADDFARGSGSGAAM